MEKEPSYSLETSLKTRNLGLVMSLILVPMLLVFMYIDHVSPPLHGILAWRVGALIPGLLFLSYALFVFPKHRRFAVPLHIVQLTGLIVMMCGITADLATRPEFPRFGKTALISSLLVCIFGDFAFAGGARKYLFAVLIPPLAAMGVYITAAGEFLTQTERIWLISNPAAMAVVLSVLALYQERSFAKEFRARRELKHAEEALRESERKYRDLFENAEVGMFRTRLDGSEVIDVNGMLLELCGRTREEMIGSPSAIHWADPHEREQLQAMLARDGRVTNYECRMLNARGEVRNCLQSVKLIPGQGVLEGSLVDITERKRLEAEREAVWQRLEFVIATTRTGLDIIDEDFIVQYVDPARRKLLGDPRGRSCHEYFRGSSVPCPECAMQAALRTRKVQVREQSLPNEDNRVTQVTALPYQNESGKWMVAEVIVDITERKHAEAERLDLERRIASSQKLEGLGILAGGIAHNFNNLLTVILGHAELLRETVPADMDPALSVREIIKAGSRSRDLVSQLLALGRRQLLDLRPLDLNRVVRGCSPMLRQALRESITIDYRLSTSPCPVAADQGRIEEILLNLALNAQDAIAEEGRLSIATTEEFLEGVFARRHDDVPPGRYVLLTVSDTGEGMDEGTIAKIFDPFFTTKEQGTGTGLGLSTVYGLVKQHKGSIEVESRPGEGTRFMIYLPRSAELPQEADASEQEQPAGGNETILLVEDEAPIRMLLSRHLRGLGYTVLEAADGVSALQVSFEHGGVIAMLVTDVVMPRMTGTELCDRLRAGMPDLKVLYMSGYRNDVIRSHVSWEGEMDLISKPFTGQALASRMREILDR